MLVVEATRTVATRALMPSFSFEIVCPPAARDGAYGHAGRLYSTKADVMQRSEVRLGTTYLARHCGQLTAVKIVRKERRGWLGLNVRTNRFIHVKSASVLIRPLTAIQAAQLGQLHDYTDMPATGFVRCCPRCGRNGLAKTISSSTTLYLHRVVSKAGTMIYEDSCVVNAQERRHGRNNARAGL
jgi:hypothetical protein